MNGVISFCERLGINRVVYCALALAMGLLMTSPAAAQVSLDTANFDTDVSAFVGPTAQTLAGVIAAVLAVFFLIAITRGGMRWIKSYNTK